MNTFFQAMSCSNIISRDAMGWYVEVEYSRIFIFVSVTWGYTDTEST